MQRLSRTILVLALVVAGAGAATGRDNASAARAEEVLKQARAAIGGEAKIGGVRGLSIKGKYRRVIQERELSGEREFDLLLPDKYMRTESVVMQGMGMSMTNTRAINGSEFWADGGRGRAGGTMMIMRGDGKEPTLEDLARAEQEQARQMRVELARYVLALLLTPSPGFPLEFTYAGEATADDGSADVIDAAGPEGFAARLFLDKRTHLPLMLSYRAPKPRVFTMMQQGGPRGGHGGKSQEELVKEAREKLKEQGEAAKPEEVEMQIRFSEYRESGGLLLPHRIASGPDGETTEEWEIKTYSVNPQFKADKFQKR
ncbi:MAG TPA: hypothetical protein VFS10_08360 [Pyrinomonadaceae bacterium]|nr:hypothetical protein [Pyrinomonadaceae bacterium]